MALVSEEQILVLPSNVENGGNFSSNTHSDYTTILKRPITYPNKSEYSVGLIDFIGQFRLADNEIFGDDSHFSIGKKSYQIKPKIYKKQNDIIKAMNRALKREIISLPLSCWEEEETNKLVIGCQLNEFYFKLSDYLQIRLGISNRNRVYHHDKPFQAIPLFSFSDSEYSDESHERMVLSRAKLYINDMIFLHIFTPSGYDKSRIDYINNQLRYKWVNFSLKGIFSILLYASAQTDFRIFFLLKPR